MSRVNRGSEPLGQRQPVYYTGVHHVSYEPLNPDGKLMFELKIENHRTLVNAQASAAVPRLAFAK